MKSAAHRFSVAAATWGLSAAIVLSAGGRLHAASPTCSDARVGLTADYAFAVGSALFSDADGDSESGSTFRWLVNGVPLAPPAPVAEGLLLHLDGATAGENGEVESSSQGVSFAAGKWGRALELDGAGKLFFARPDNVDLAEGSIEMWVALRSDGTDPVYAGRSHVLFHFEAPNRDSLAVAQAQDTGILYGGGTVGGQWQSAYGPQASTRAWGAAEWHHLLFSYSVSGNFMRFYVDGALTADTNEGRYQAPSAGGSEFSVGGTPWGEAAYCWIDEVRLAGRAPSAEEVAGRARRLDAPRPNEVWLPTSTLSPGDVLVFEYTPAAGGEQGTPCLSAPLAYPGIPVFNPRPASTLLKPGTTSLHLAVETLDATDCAWAVGAPLPYAAMTPFDDGAGQTIHETDVRGLDPDPLCVNHVYVRCAAHPDFVFEAVYRSLGTANPRFPRTGNLWGWWNFDGRDAADVARIDLWLGADFAPERVNELRWANPDIIVLTSINAVENTGLPDDYYLKDTNGNRIEVWPGSFRLNLTKAYVAEYQARFAYQRLLDGGLAQDGVFFDNVMTTQSWLTSDIYGNPVQIDADEDGRPDDPAVLDAAWKAGVFHEIEAFRALMPDAIVSAHSINIDEPGIADLFNGISIGFWTANVLEGEMSFLELWDRYHAWLSRAKPPAVTMIESSPVDQIAYGYDYSPWAKIPPSTLEFARTYYPWMRFGLCLTLMDDGYFAQEYGDTWHGNDWWYDELDFDLGWPLGSPARVDLGGGPGPNGIENPGFEAPIAWPWGLWANTAAGCAASVAPDTTGAPEGATSARIDITAVSGVDWHIDFAQQARTLVQGVTYDVTFRAKSDHARPIAVGSSQGVPPWTGYGLDQGVSLGTAWDEHTVSFEAAATAADARVQFFVGAETGTVWIDDVRLTLHPPDVFGREFTNGIVLLNGTASPRTVTLGPGYRRLSGTQAPAVETILDDTGAGFTTTGPWLATVYDSGEWQAAGPFYHAWGGSLQEMMGAQGEATWTLPVPFDDTYTITAWWPAAPPASGWNQAAVYEVRTSGGVLLASATLDQTAGGDEWHPVAELPLRSADQPYVRLVCRGAPCVADALHVRSLARYNDGSAAAAILLQPLDGIVLERDPNQHADLVADAGSDVTACRGVPAPLGGAPAATGGTGPYRYAWSPTQGLDDPALPNPVAAPATNTVYTLTVFDSAGHWAADSVSVHVRANDPPADPGNSLLLSRDTLDIELLWAAAGVYGYRVIVSNQRDMGAPQVLFPDVSGETTRHTNGVPPDAGGDLRLYRVETLGCH